MRCLERQMRVVLVLFSLFKYKIYPLHVVVRFLVFHASLFYLPSPLTALVRRNAAPAEIGQLSADVLFVCCRKRARTTVRSARLLQPLAPTNIGSVHDTQQQRRQEEEQRHATLMVLRCQTEKKEMHGDIEFAMHFDGRVNTAAAALRCAARRTPRRRGRCRGEGQRPTDDDDGPIEL